MNHLSLHHVPTWMRSARTTLFVLLATLSLVACQKPEPAAPPSAQGRPMVPVGVITATPSTVVAVTDLPGRVDASRVAQVRARVAGIVQKREFVEGSDVKAGQLLYSIDAAPYQAAVQSAKAALAKAEANAWQARLQVERYRPLVAANAVSRQDFVNYQSADRQAQAEVAAAKASLASAQINLGYASVTAPIDGRIGQALVTEGALVGQGTATELAVIQQIDPVYVNFTQSAADAFRLRQAIQKGQMTAAGEQASAVKVLLDDGTAYEVPGKLLFSDISVDPSTGQVTLRAEIPNPQGLLLPGLYVRVQMEIGTVNQAIAVPQQAVTRTQAGNVLMVVDAQGNLSPRNVQIAMAKDNQWIVEQGLQPGEQVVVDGLEKLQLMPPGTGVKPVPWTPPGAASAAPAQAAKPAAQ